MSTGGWTRKKRFGDDVWLHKAAPVWIVEYPSIADVRPCAKYLVYRSVEQVKPGREPWTVDNRRIGTERGWPTLAEAMSAAESYIRENMQRWKLEIIRPGMSSVVSYYQTLDWAVLVAGLPLYRTYAWMATRVEAQS